MSDVTPTPRLIQRCRHDPRWAAGEIMKLLEKLQTPLEEIDEMLSKPIDYVRQ